MNTILDLSRYLYDRYVDALKRLDEKESLIEAESFNSDFYDQVMEELKQDDEKYTNALLLLTVYYYSFHCNEYGEDFDELLDPSDENYNEIINIVENGTKQELLDFLEENDAETDYIFDMFDLYVSEELGFMNFSNDKEIEESYPTDIDVYGTVTYKKFKDDNSPILDFHPNIVEEDKNFYRYTKNEALVTYCASRNITNVSSFVLAFNHLKTNLDGDYNYLYDFVEEFVTTNYGVKEDLCNKILVLVMKYSYLKRLNEKNPSEDLEEFEVRINNLLNNLNNVELYINFINDFETFTMLDFMELYSNITEEQRKQMDEFINLDNIKRYGTNGIWIDGFKDINVVKSYNKSFRRDISEAFNNGLNVSVYLSEDSKKDNTIPRLLIIYDNNREVKDIIGAGSNKSIENDMIGVLKRKSKAFVLNEEFKRDLNNLEKYIEIDEKQTKEEDLTKEEIEFLYNITEYKDKTIFGREYDLITALKEDPSVKKNLANYFGVIEELVSYSYEADEESVIIVGDRSIGLYDFYPNLRFVFGNVYADTLDNADGIPSL